MENKVNFSVNSLKNNEVKNNNIDDNIDDNINNTKIESIDVENNEYNDISLIECFWGTDINRISSTIQALQKLINQKFKIKDWIFIEAQKTKSDCSFKWVKKYGIKYIFKKIEKQSEGLFLKMPLWNIGVKNSTGKYLCFIDSDVYFDKNNWLNEVNNIFQLYDVISLAGYVRYGVSGIIDSIGHCILRNKLEFGTDSSFKYGHCGFTLGMTRKAYEKYGKFDAVNYLDDQWFWFTIVGKQDKFEKMFLLPYDPSDFNYYGYPFKIGSTELTCIHIDHKSDNMKTVYDNANMISYQHCDFPMEDIEYENVDVLPKWKQSKFGNVMKKCFSSIYNGKSEELSYEQNALNEFGRIDSKNPLIIMTIYHPDYQHKNKNEVILFKEHLKAHVKDKFTFICFSPEDIDGIDVIRYKMKRGMSKEYYVKQILENKKIVYPKNSNVAIIDIDTKFSNEIYFPQCVNTISDYKSKKYGICKNLIYFRYDNKQR